MVSFKFHVERLTGQRALLIAWGIWGLFFLITPVNPVVLDDTGAIILLVVSNVALFLGLSASQIVGAASASARVTPIEMAKLRKMLAILIVAGVASFVLRFFDYFVVRGVPLSLNVQDIRSALEAVGPNMISALYGIIAPATVAGGLLAITLLWSGVRDGLAKVALLPFLATPAFSFLYGGRVVLFIIGAIAVVAMLLTVPRITRGLVAGIALGGLALFFITMGLFLTRIDEMGTDVMYMARSSRFTELVPVNDDVLAAIDDAPEWLGRLIFYVVSVGQYYLHGVFEFLGTVRQFVLNGDSYLWGRNQFFVVNQVIAVFQGERVDFDDLNPSSGVYSTFWGPAFIDFGYIVTPIYAFLFGAVVDYFRRQVASGDVFALPLYVLFLVQIALVPVHNGIVMGAALYYNIGLFGVWLIGRTISPGNMRPAGHKFDAFACKLVNDPLTPVPAEPGSARATALATGKMHNIPVVESSREERSARGTSPMAVVEAPPPHLQAAEPPAPKPRLQRLIGLLGSSWRFGLGAAVVTLVLALAALAALRLAVPATTTYRSVIQLTFPEAPFGTYPNKVPFSINEIVEPAVLSRVYDQLKLEQYGLTRDDFYAAFSIRPASASEQEISDRFRQRLADRRLTFAERERLEAQHKSQLDQAARSAAELTFTLHQRIPLPRDVGQAVVQMVPLVWSQQAIEQKGALRFPGYFTTSELLPVDAVQRLPAPFAVVTTYEAAGRLRGRLNDLSGLPGIVTMVDPETGRSFRDYEAQFRELELFRVNVLLSMATQHNLGGDYSQAEGLILRHMRDIELRANYEQKLADTVQETIRRFVDSVVGLKGRQGGERRTGGGDQTVMSGTTTIPQLSEGFIDRVIELSGRGREAEQAFISTMTERQLVHQERVTALNAEYAKWKELLDAIQSKGGGRAPPPAEARDGFTETLASTVRELNLLWAALTRIQTDFAENRVGRTARLFVPLQADARTNHPIFQSWLILSLLALGLLAVVAFWGLGAWRTFRSQSRGRSAQ